MAGAEGLSMTFDERKLFQEIIVTIKVRRDWRCKVGLWLARLAGWLCGFGVKEQQEGES